TPAYQKAMNKRKVWVEPLFAEAKDWHGMRRFRLRRLWRVNCEAQVIAAGQNLKRLLAIRGAGDGVPSQQRPCLPLFYFFYAFCSSICRESLTNAGPTASMKTAFSKGAFVPSPTSSAFPTC